MSDIISNLVGQNLELPNAELIFYPRLFQQPENDQLFSELFHQIQWKQEPIKIFGKSSLLLAWEKPGVLSLDVGTIIKSKLN